MTAEQRHTEDYQAQGSEVQMVVVPQRMAPALLQFANTLQGRDGGEGGEGGEGGVGEVLPACGTGCRYTNPRPPHDLHCGDSD